MDFIPGCTITPAKCSLCHWLKEEPCQNSTLWDHCSTATWKSYLSSKPATLAPGQSWQGRIYSCSQPTNISSLDFIKMTTGMKLWINKGKLSGRRCFYHSKLRSFQHKEVPSCFPCWNKALWFQSSRLCSMGGRKKRKKKRKRVFSWADEPFTFQF